MCCLPWKMDYSRSKRNASRQMTRGALPGGVSSWPRPRARVTARRTWRTGTQPCNRSALFGKSPSSLPVAKQMSNISGGFFITTPQAWSLHPALRALAVQPGRTSPRRFITVAETESRDLVIAYIPEDRTLELYLDALSPAPGIQWFNPRTAQRSPAVAVVGARTCQLPTPDTGDWLLVMKNGK